jgi:hypothetical protein
MERHLRSYCDVCPSTLEQCAACNASVPRSQMVTHVEKKVSHLFECLAETIAENERSRTEEVETLRMQLVQSALEMLSLKKELGRDSSCSVKVLFSGGYPGAMSFALRDCDSVSVARDGPARRFK